MFAPDGLLGRRASLLNKAAQPQLPQATAAPLLFRCSCTDRPNAGRRKDGADRHREGPSLAATEEEDDRANWCYRGSHHCQSSNSWRIGILHSTEKRRLGDAGDWPEEKSRETGVLMAIDTRIGGWKKLQAMQG